MNNSSNVDLALLLLRAALGVVFLAHGFSKLLDVPGTTAFFASVGLATFFVYLIIIVEIGAGLLMVLGYFVNVAGSALALIMLGAMFFVKFKAGFLGGYEYDLVLLLTALAVALLGAGAYSLDHLFERD